MSDRPWTKGPEERARLIAAAPELAEALIGCIKQIEYLHDKFKETGSGNTEIARAREALKKAGWTG